jgi:hypothetical protein
LGKAGLTRSGMSPGTTQVSAQVRFRVTCSGMTWVSDSVKVLGSDSGKESGTISDKDPGKR